MNKLVRSSRLWNADTSVPALRIKTQSILKLVIVSLSMFAATSAIGEENSGLENATEVATAAAVALDNEQPMLANIHGDRIIAADQEPNNWLAHGRNYQETRFSPLDSITTANVSELGLAWSFDYETHRGMEATPIVVDGMMFTTGTWSIAYAHDAKTGELLWTYDPKVNKERAVFGCCDVVNRGVAVWKGRVYLGTFDGRLVALDAKTGAVVWEKLTIDQSKPYTITGAPRVVKGNVIIGNGGAEFGVRGYVSAYDAVSGEMVWRFYTVPGDPDKPVENEAMKTAMDTWKGGEWWKAGGGGTVWDSMAFDPELDLLYVGVGNGSPWNRFKRSPGGGDNLYLSSILALRPDTGEYVWHYQTTPGDSWDYTATQHMILADLTIQGKERKVLMQAPKNGFFYVLDRQTGELLSAEPYVFLNWATHVDLETGRPVETEEQYEKEMKVNFPSPYGGHNWHPMSFNKQTGLVYIPAMDAPFFYAQDNNYEHNPYGWNIALDVGVATVPLDEDMVLTKLMTKKIAKGILLAWDPIQQKEAWRVEHENLWNGGTLTTAGNLVFQGTGKGQFVAYAADTGKPLWSFATQTGIIAPPMTYSIDGEQYVTLSAGWGGAFALAGGPPAGLAGVKNLSRLLTFKLNGKASLPELPEEPFKLAKPPELDADEATIAKGWEAFAIHCSVCHGNAVVGGGVIPDLRHSDAETHKIWDAIVLGGIYRDRGMVSFANSISPDESAAIQAYVIERAHHEYNAWMEEQEGGFFYKLKVTFYDLMSDAMMALVK